MLGIEGPFLYKVMDAVYEMMTAPYPELTENTDDSRKALKFEEERFAHTLSSGMGILDKLIDDVKSSGKDMVPGVELFKLYDTYGFPLDLAKDIAGDSGLGIDEKGFNEEMEVQKTRARASWVGGEEDASGVYRDIKNKTGPTEFLGYEALQTQAFVNALIKDGIIVEEAGEGMEIEVILDKTVSYGESGGQLGDTGTIKTKSMKFEVLNTKKFGDLIIHKGVVKKGVIRREMTVQASVEVDRRRSIMRNHTATHLLHTALRTVLGDHIKQAGSLVSPDRLRFDFTHFFAMDQREIIQVEDIVNEEVINDLPVDISETTLDKAVSKGVTALFGEKYGDTVRVVRAGDFSAELCGGIHCHATGEIGPFKIISEGSAAAGIRRIEALTGFAALEFNKEREIELKKTAALLKVNEMKVSERTEKILGDLKQQEKELDKYKHKAVSGGVDTILEKTAEIDKVKVIAHKAEGLDMRSLRNLADTLKDKIGSGVIVLGSAVNGQAYYVSVVTKDLVSRFNAGAILKAVTGGKGGGRPDMAQGGTKDPAAIDKAIGSVGDIIKGTNK
jgi:alanyl-tRNA synthetase